MTTSILEYRLTCPAVLNSFNSFNAMTEKGVEIVRDPQAPNQAIAASASFRADECNDAASDAVIALLWARRPDVQEMAETDRMLFEKLRLENASVPAGEPRACVATLWVPVAQNSGDNWKTRFVPQESTAAMLLRTIPELAAAYEGFKKARFKSENHLVLTANPVYLGCAGAPNGDEPYWVLQAAGIPDDLWLEGDPGYLAKADPAFRKAAPLGFDDDISDSIFIETY